MAKLEMSLEYLRHYTFHVRVPRLPSNLFKLKFASLHPSKHLESMYFLICFLAIFKPVVRSMDGRGGRLRIRTPSRKEEIVMNCDKFGLNMTVFCLQAICDEDFEVNNYAMLEYAS